MMMMHQLGNPLPDCLNPPGSTSTRLANRKHLLDIWMDKMTGMVLLAHLRARSPKTHVIFITGCEDHAAKTTVMQAGAIAFFVKPFGKNGFFGSCAKCVWPHLSEKGGSDLSRISASDTFASRGKAIQASRYVFKCVQSNRDVWKEHCCR